MKQLFLVIILSFSSSVLQAEVYKGTIGKNTAIVLELQKGSDGSYEGRYFYNKHKRDILLSGNLQRLEERPASEHFSSKPKSYWQGKLVNNEFVGTWISLENNKHLPLRLSKIGESTFSSLLYPLEGNKKRSKYDALKMLRALKYSDPVKHGNVSFRWLTDPISSVKYPIIFEHPSKKKKERLNKMLMKQFWHYALDYDDCDSVPGVTVNYLSEKVLDITEGGSIYCGGAHPSNFIRPKTFDFSTGKEIQWRGYLVGIAATEYWEEITDLNLLNKVRKAIKSNSDWQEECDNLISFDTEKNLNTLSFHITKKNMITVGLGSVPHALSPCASDYADLPLSAFKLLPRKAGEGLF